MARQRFIHPTLWEDPLFGKLQPLEQLLFIGLFSIADDEGRLIAEPAFLRAQLFTYKDYTNKKVLGIRDSVVEKMSNVHLYRAEGCEYIALLKWHEYQKPKYPTPSKLPAPFLESSPSLPPGLEKDSPNTSPPGRVGKGRDGKGRVGQESSDEDSGAPVYTLPASADLEIEIDKLLKLKGCDENTPVTLAVYAKQLPLAVVADIRTRAQEQGKGIGWAVNALKGAVEERSAA